MKNYLKLIRIRHYVKNLLILAALACSGQFFDLGKLTTGIMAFITFCMTSSAVYIINDVIDRERDKKHPTKCNRPIAMGTVSIKSAWIFVFALLVGATICNLLIYRIISTIFLILYFILNLAYSFGLKNIPIMDVVILVSGFLIRVIYGAFVTGIPISNWFYLTVVMIAFYCAFGKRRNEIRQVGVIETRQVLNEYSINYLDKNMWMCLTLANVFYTLWTMDEKTIRFYNTEYLIFTVPIVLLITMKYSLAIEKNDSDGDPVEVLFHDKILLILCVSYLAVMLVILY